MARQQVPDNPTLQSTAPQTSLGGSAGAVAGSLAGVGGATQRTGGGMMTLARQIQQVDNERQAMLVDQTLDEAEAKFWEHTMLNPDPIKGDWEGALKGIADNVTYNVKNDSGLNLGPMTKEMRANVDAQVSKRTAAMKINAFTKATQARVQQTKMVGNMRWEKALADGDLEKADRIAEGMPEFMKDPVAVERRKMMREEKEINMDTVDVPDEDINAALADLNEEGGKYYDLPDAEKRQRTKILNTRASVAAKEAIQGAEENMAREEKKGNPITDKVFDRIMGVAQANSNGLLTDGDIRKYKKAFKAETNPLTAERVSKLSKEINMLKRNWGGWGRGGLSDVDYMEKFREYERIVTAEAGGKPTVLHGILQNARPDVMGEKIILEENDKSTMIVDRQLSAGTALRAQANEGIEILPEVKKHMEQEPKFIREFVLAAVTDRVSLDGPFENSTERLEFIDAQMEEAIREVRKWGDNVPVPGYDYIPDPKNMALPAGMPGEVDEMVPLPSKGEVKADSQKEAQKKFLGGFPGG